MGLFEPATCLDGKMSSNAQEMRQEGTRSPVEAWDVWDRIPALLDDNRRSGEGCSARAWAQKPSVSHTSFSFSRVFPVKLEPPASWVPE